MSIMSTTKKDNTIEDIDSHMPDPQHIEPFTYINSVPGKNVRGILIDCFQVWFNIPPPEQDQTLSIIKEIIGILHNASLLIDDIEDNSHLRRGVPVAHKIFGVPSVINCANYMYFIALEKCNALKNTEAMEVFVKEMLNLHRGQANDIMWRDTMKCPTEQEYCDMVIDKTGGLFRLAIGLMQSFASSHKNTDFVPLVNNLALYFQIRDDLVNLADPEYFKSKSFCEDLTEGKFSFPIIHCVRKDTSDHKLLSILKQRTDDIDIKRYAQGIMRDAGSLVYTREKCKQLKVEISKDILGLGGNPALLKLMDMLDVQVDGLAESIITPKTDTRTKSEGSIRIDSA